MFEVYTLGEIKGGVESTIEGYGIGILLGLFNGCVIGKALGNVEGCALGEVEGELTQC